MRGAQGRRVSRAARAKDQRRAATLHRWPRPPLRAQDATAARAAAHRAPAARTRRPPRTRAAMSPPAPREGQSTSPARPLRAAVRRNREVQRDLFEAVAAIEAMRVDPLDAGVEPEELAAVALRLGDQPLQQALAVARRAMRGVGDEIVDVQSRPEREHLVVAIAGHRAHEMFAFGPQLY